MTMSLVIAEGLEQNKCSIIEAGTGTGKSFAELIPTLLAVVRHNILNRDNPMKLIVTTHTITLQSQLYYNDVPFLERVFSDIGLPFKSVLLKGKSNYICLQKLEKALKRNPNEAIKDEFNLLLDSITDEAGNVVQGDKEKLPFQPSETLWECVGGGLESNCDNCRYREEGCFYYHLKDYAEEADVIIGNHFLLMADLIARQKSGYKPGTGIVPDYHVVVIDEAHHLEDVASGFIGFTIDEERVNRTLDRVQALYNFLYKDYQTERRVKALELCHEVKKMVEEIFSITRRALEASDAHSMIWSDKSAFRRIDFSPLEELENYLLFTAVRTNVEALEAKFNSLANRVKVLKEELKQFVYLQNEFDEIYWVDQNGLHKTPAEIASHLREMLFDRHNVVMTSATIKFDKDLSVFARRIGNLQEHEYVSTFMQSPFNYKDNVCFYVPSYALDCGNEGYDAYCVREMYELVKMSKGRAFLLFTSIETMKEYHSILSKEFEKMGYLTLMQGQYDRRVLIEKFKEHGNAVLFGSDTFWEGIDIRGRELSLVVIHKLPFNVPTPVTKAREAILRKQGRDPFLENVVFSAVTKYKQGFGRLIRHEGDKGVFCVLDGRILSKKDSYGKYFLSSMPETQITVDRERTKPFFE